NNRECAGSLHRRNRPCSSAGDARGQARKRRAPRGEIARRRNAALPRAVRSPWIASVVPPAPCAPDAPSSHAKDASPSPRSAGHPDGARASPLAMDSRLRTLVFALWILAGALAFCGVFPLLDPSLALELRVVQSVYSTFQLFTLGEP